MSLALEQSLTSLTVLVNKIKEAQQVILKKEEAKEKEIAASEAKQNELVKQYNKCEFSSLTANVLSMMDSKQQKQIQKDYADILEFLQRITLAICGEIKAIP